MARSVQKYLRNLYGSPAYLTLQSKRRIEFAPRGMRGDLQPITKEEAKDPAVLLNVGVLVEIVSEAEALKTMEKMATNQQAVHPALRMVGQENVEMDVLAENEGVVAAQLEDGQVVIKPGKNGGIQRAPQGVGPKVGNTPGSEAEMAHILAADDGARNNTDLTAMLGVRQD